MNFIIENHYTEDVYKKKNQDYCLCLIRKKLVQYTPEEKVRQAVISFFINDLKIPKHLIEVEFPLARLIKGSKGRIDIIVFDEDGYSLLITECKAHNIMLTDKSFEQIAKYDEIAEADFLFITNGSKESSSPFVYDKEENIYLPLEYIPNYSEMLNSQYEIQEFEEKVFLRVKENEFRNLEKIKQEYDFLIAEKTELSLVRPIIKLYEAIFDEAKKLDNFSCRGGKLIQDFGNVLMSFGNASGGQYDSVYRGFLIEDNAGQLFTLYITIVCSSNGNSYLNVAMDDGLKSHNSLQLRLNGKNLRTSGENYGIYHDGALTNGNKGRVPNEYIFSRIEKEGKELLKNNEIFLGEFKTNTDLQITDLKVLIGNLIDYVIVREKIRGNRE